MTLEGNIFFHHIPSSLFALFFPSRIREMRGYLLMTNRHFSLAYVKKVSILRRKSLFLSRESVTILNSTFHSELSTFETFSQRRDDDKVYEFVGKSNCPFESVDCKNRISFMTPFLSLSWEQS